MQDERSAHAPIQVDDGPSTSSKLSESPAITDGGSSPFVIRAEQVVKRILRVKPPTAREVATAHGLFNVSILISATRCLLTYIVGPFVIPALGALAVPGVGIAFSLIAVGFDVRALRRFWQINYRHRWGMTALYLALIVFMFALLGIDVSHLITHA